MANIKAVANGNWSNTATWDGGTLPTSADDVFANGFTITINGTFTVLTIRNTASPILVANIATPAMTSNNTPSGVVFASSVSGNNFSWNAFSQDGTTALWQSGTGDTGILGYEFTSGKVIKRYVLRMINSVVNSFPTAWTFQGSNDGVSYTTLDTVTGAAIPSGGNYISSVLANTTSYTYYRINITAVNTAGTSPTIGEFELTESTSAVIGSAAGGQFIYANGGELTCTAAQAIFLGSTTPTLQMTLASPNTATFNGSVLTMPAVLNYHCIRLSSSGTLNCNGDYSIDNSTNNNRAIIQLTSVGTINIVGNLSLTSTAGGSYAHAVRVDGAGTINITGNVTGGPGVGLAIVTIGGSAAALINITGNVSTTSFPAISLSTSSTLNIIGNVSTSGVQPAIHNATTAATISVTGIITAGVSAPAIYSSFALGSGYSSGTFVRVSGTVFNSANNIAIVAPRVTIDTNTSSWLFGISTGGNRTLYAPGVPLGNPPTGSVRFGTAYGTSNELTGSMRVPSSSNVLQGVEVGNTTGTLLMTPADFWNYLIASGFTADSIGDRLQNASTVATTGGQIANYNI